MKIARAALFIGGMFATIIGFTVVFRAIIAYTDPEAVLVMQVFAGIAWALGWVARGIRER